MRLRRLTSEGIQKFRDYLAVLRSDRRVPPPFELLEDGVASESMPIKVTLDRPGFVTKMDAARYLKGKLGDLPLAEVTWDTQLWSWLALFFFDDVCPSVDGIRKPVADPHYILDSMNHKRRYRHLLATPFQIIHALPEHNRIFLNAPLPIHGDLIEQTMSRLFLIRIPAVREAIDYLYFNVEEGKAKKGIINKTPRRGDLRSRFVKRVQQLSLTYDVASMDGHRLVDALGSEFAGWQSNGKT